MKTVSLRKRFFMYFMAITAVLLFINLALSVVHLVIVSKYENIQDNIFDEYRLIGAVSDLVDRYNNYRNGPNESNLSAYAAKKSELADILATLERSLEGTTLEGKFLGVRNTIENIASETDRGIQSLRAGDLEGTSARYTEAYRKLSFVRENVTNLILEDIQRSSALHAGVQRANQLFLIFGAVLVTSVMLGVGGASDIWSRRLVTPLSRLTENAESVTRGDLDTEIAGDLISGEDEVGRLARAFNTMTSAIRRNIDSLKRSNAEIQEKSAALAGKVAEVENSRRAILNLLEDIEEDKSKAESMVRQRTCELADEKARLVASINSLSFGFVIADKNDQILLRNPAIDRIFEFKTAPKSLHDIADSLRGGKNIITVDPVKSCRECMEMRQIVEIKDVFYGKKYLRIFCAPIEGPEDGANEGVLGYVFLVEDVTEAKVLERSRDEFFSIASHELRTPLTAIRGNSEMILDMYADKVADKDLKEMLVDIHASSIRLIDIVNDFLEVSRIEQGRIDLKFENFELDPVMQKVVKDLRSMAQRKNLELTYKGSANLPLVRADRNRIEQVLINLIGNSIKFTEKGSIEVSTERIGDFVKISVTDTGIGISEKNQLRLFRKFQQAGESMLARDVTQGTGLGLYISQLLLSSMGGTIGIERSELGKGSTFAFTIPVMV